MSYPIIPTVDSDTKLFPQPTMDAIAETLDVGQAVQDYLAEHPSADLQAHIDSPTPHPAYDDVPDLVVLFENGLIA